MDKIKRQIEMAEGIIVELALLVDNWKIGSVINPDVSLNWIVEESSKLQDLSEEDNNA